MPTSAHDLAPGLTLGEFVVREKLGEGGFGSVYLAEQPVLGRDAVIKVLRTQLTTRDDHVQRFLREARLLSRLDHPYAAHVYAFGAETGGLMWIAMERVRGTALDEVLRSRGPIPVERFVPLFERICDVVFTAHEQGIVHRDIKPANVMVISRAGRLLPKLLDFGIAKANVVLGAAGEGPAPDELWALDEEEDKDDEELDDEPSTPPRDIATVTGQNQSGGNGVSAGTATGEGSSPRPITPPDAVGPVDSGATTAPVERAPKAPPTLGKSLDLDLTRAGTMMGSPPYIAPEQWRDATAVDARTDIYALGVLAYECLAGRRPFVAKTMRQMARAHAREEVPPLPEALPARLHAVLARAMAKRPEDRFANALDLAAAVRAAAGLADDEESLPRLEGPTRDAALHDAPQPLAEAVAALDAARSAHEARDALREVVAVAARWLGLVAMACRTRVGSGGKPDSPALVDRLVTLRRRDLKVDEWVVLARELSQPLAETPDAYPIPELVTLLHTGADPFVALEGGAARTARAEVERLIPLVGRLLGALTPLWSYPLAVRRGALVELWSGVRRPRRAPAPAVAPELPEGEPVLLDADLARPVPNPPLSLAPLAQIAAPSAGAAPELFLLAGPGRHGALLVAPPHGFERHDPDLWKWCQEHLLPLIGDAAAAADEKDAPYAGLAPFTRERADRFYGREREIEEFLNRLRLSSLGAVVGPSGAGKSSFVQAGVLPSLPAGWEAITMRPGPSPMAALRARLAEAGWGELDVQAAGGLSALLRARAQATGGTAVLVVDQLEELLTLCRDEAERERFAGALGQAAGPPESPVRVLLTLRDDFLIRAEALPGLRGRLTAGLELLGTPSAADLTRILVEPARRAGYELEDRALAAEIVQAVSGLPAALPLLSFTASRLWDLRDRQFRHLSRRAYDALGGVAGALAQHAEQTLADMVPEEQRLVREAFRHLVTADGTRAVIARTDLVALLRGPLAASVVEKLVAARLCTTGDDDRIELTHESLVATWPRLAAWRREDQEGARLLGQLRAAARQWDERGRPRGLLWLGDALAEYRLWRRRFPGSLTATEEGFAAASESEDRRGRRFRRGLVGVVFAALVGLVLVLLRLNSQSRAEEEASRRRELDQFQELGRQALLGQNYGTALVYLSEARSHGLDTPSLRLLIGQASAPYRRLVETTKLVDGSVTSLALSPDGKWLVAGGFRGGVALWNGTDPPRALPAHAGMVEYLAFSPDGKVLVSAGVDTVVHRWHLDDDRALPSFVGHTGRISGVAFSRGGDLVTWGMEAILWDQGAGTPFLRFRPEVRLRGGLWLPSLAAFAIGDSAGRVHLLGDADFRRLGTWSAAKPEPVRWFSRNPEGTLVAAATGNTVRVWRPGSEVPLATFEGQDSEVRSAVLSLDGLWLATGSEDHTVKIWNLGTGRLARSMSGHRQAVSVVSFSPNGERLASGSQDGSIRVWDTETGLLRLHLPARGPGIQALTWSADGVFLFSGEQNGYVSRWNTSDDISILGREAPASESRFSGPDELLRATASSIEAWRLSGDAPQLVAQLPVALDDRAPYLSSSHTAVGGVSPTGECVVVDRTNGALAPLPGSQGIFAFSPDGTQAATSSAAGDALLWRLTPTPEIVGRFPHAAAISHVVFDVTGTRIVTLATDRHLRVWDVAGKRTLVDVPSEAHDALVTTSDRVVTLDDTRVHILGLTDGRPKIDLHTETYLLGVSASADGALLVTGGTDGQLLVWDGTSGVPLLQLQGSESGLPSVDISPDGQWVVGTRQDGTTVLWALRADPTPPDVLADAVRCWAPLRIERGALVGVPHDPCVP